MLAFTQCAKLHR